MVFKKTYIEFNKFIDHERELIKNFRALIFKKYT
jgi:hypothetical protein